MIKVQRTAWALSEEGMSNEDIADEITSLTGKEITPRVVAVNIGRFDGKIRNSPEKLFDSLLEDSDIQDAEKLAEIIEVDIEEADEIIQTKMLNDDQILRIIQHYDANIAVDPRQEPTPDPGVKKVVQEIDGVTLSKEYHANPVEYATDAEMIRLTKQNTLDALLKRMPNEVHSLVEGLSIQVGCLGDPRRVMTLADIENEFAAAKHELKERVTLELAELLEDLINRINRKETSNETKNPNPTS